MGLVVTALNGRASSCFNSLPEADTQDWSTSTLSFPEQIDIVTAQYQAQAQDQNAQLNTHESISIYACRVEDLVDEGWREIDARMCNRECVKLFIQQLPFKLQRLANETKIDHHPTLEKPGILFEVLKNYIKRQHIAHEMTPKPSNEIK